ncbi:MAG: WG repeat-containing protein, partial [Neisseriaceae bacterium]|nr:WG repeat-containing protein [Neisseriaceae bacterium]
VNLQGKLVLPIEYYKIDDFHNGFAIIDKSGTQSGYGVIDQKLNFILPPEYSDIDFFKDGFAQISVKGNSHWGDLNHRGQVVIGGVAYDRVEPFNNGVAKIYKGNKAWRVDYSGQVFGIPEENKQQKENNQTKDKEYLNHLKEIERLRKSNQ